MHLYTGRNIMAASALEMRHALLLEEAKQRLHTDNAVDDSLVLDGKFLRCLSTDEPVLSGKMEAVSIVNRCRKNRVVVFVSSTFEDTKFENDYLLRHVFPFLKRYCAVLQMDFNAISMRWGVRSGASNDHDTADMCMKQLHDCLEQSAGLAYITLQSHRYGYCPFPNIILAKEFEELLRRAERMQLKDEYLRAPYWRLDTSAVPLVYMLQPVNTIPTCEDYLLTDEEKERCRQDTTYKDARMKSQSAAGNNWWGIFGEIQSVLRAAALIEGDAADSNLALDIDVEKYFISVTHDEVNRGVIRNPDASNQCLYIERTIEGLVDALAQGDSPASSYMDSVAPPSTAASAATAQQSQVSTCDAIRIPNAEIAAIHGALKDQIRSCVGPSLTFSLSAPWVGDNKLHKSQDAPPIQWSEYINQFSDAVVHNCCKMIIRQYRAPLPDWANEVLGHRAGMLRKLACAGFDRKDVVDAVLQYCLSVACDGDNDDDNSNSDNDTSDSSDSADSSEGSNSGGDGYRERFGCSSAASVAALAYPTTAQATNANASNIVHRGVACDSCGMHPIIGPRFYCTQRDDFDLCSACVLDDPHKNTMVQILARVTRRPQVLHGASGSGKTWVMAHSLKVLQKALPHAIIVYRLLGVSRDSSDALRLLQSLYTELMVAYKRTHRTAEQFTWEQAAALFAEGEIFKELHVTIQRPLVIVLDALDQLGAAHGALRSLSSWLPGLQSPLPPYVRIVVSTLPTVAGIALLPQLAANSSRTDRKLYADHLDNNGTSFNDSPISNNMVEIPPLCCENKSVSEAVSLMVNSLPLMGTILPRKRVLSFENDRLLRVLIANHPTPLFADLAVGIVAKWPSYAAIETHHQVLELAAASGVHGLINYIFTRMEEQHGLKLVSAALGLLSTARDGLSVAELEDVLSLKDEVLDDVFEWWNPPVRRLPPMVVQRMLSSLGSYIVESGSREGVLLLNFYHRQFAEVASMRYCSDGTVLRAHHVLLARYFGNLVESSVSVERVISDQPLVRGEHNSVWLLGAENVNSRRVVEAYYHLYHADMLEELVAETCNLRFICAAVKVGEAYAVLRCLMDASKTLPQLLARSSLTPMTKAHFHSQSNETVKRLADYIYWLRDSLTTIALAPSVNISSTAADMPTASRVRQDVAFLLGETAHLAGVFSKSSWIRGITVGRKSADDDQGCLVTLRGHTLDVTCMAWSPDGSRLASAARYSNDVHIWDTLTGEPVSKYTEADLLLRFIRWCPDNIRIATTAMHVDGIDVWESTTATLLFKVQGAKEVMWSPSEASLLSSISYGVFSGILSVYSTVDWSILCSVDTSEAVAMAASSTHELVDVASATPQYHRAEHDTDDQALLAESDAADDDSDRSSDSRSSSNSSDFFGSSEDDHKRPSSTQLSAVNWAGTAANPLLAVIYRGVLSTWNVSSGVMIASPINIGEVKDWSQRHRRCVTLSSNNETKRSVIRVVNFESCEILMSYECSFALLADCVAPAGAAQGARICFSPDATLLLCAPQVEGELKRKSKGVVSPAVAFILQVQASQQAPSFPVILTYRDQSKYLEKQRDFRRMLDWQWACIDNSDEPSSSVGGGTRYAVAAIASYGSDLRDARSKKYSTISVFNVHVKLSQYSSTDFAEASTGSAVCSGGAQNAGVIQDVSIAGATLGLVTDWKKTPFYAMSPRSNQTAVSTDFESKFVIKIMAVGLQNPEEQNLDHLARDMSSHAVAHPREGQQQQSHDDGLSSVVWSPDGFFLATASVDSTIKVWKTSALGLGDDLLYTLQGHSAAVTCLAWSCHSSAPSVSSGSFLASASHDGTFCIWSMGGSYNDHNLCEGAIQCTDEHLDSAILSLDWRPEASTKIVASGSADGVLRLWWLDQIAADRPKVHNDENAAGAGRSLQLIASSRGGDAQDASGETSHHAAITCVRWSPSGDLLASAIAEVNTITLWTATPSLAAATPTPTTSIALSALLVFGNSSRFRNPLMRVKPLAWSPNSQSIASAGPDNAVEIWDVSEAVTAALTSQNNSFANDTGSRIQSSLCAKMIDNSHRNMMCNDFVHCLAWNRSVLAAACAHSLVRLWDVTAFSTPMGDSGTDQYWRKEVDARDDNRCILIRTLEGHCGSVQSVDWSSADGNRLATCSIGDTAARVWDSIS